jgi:hypothetical protein
MARYFMQPDTRLSAGCSQENLFVFLFLMQNANQREAAIGFVLNLQYDFCVIFEFQIRNISLSY